MSWLTLISAMLQLAVKFLDWAQTRQELAAGEAQAIAANLKETNARVDKARAARRSADTAGMRDDDPYRRD